MKPEVEAAHSLIGLGCGKNVEVSGVGDALCAVLIAQIDVRSRLTSRFKCSLHVKRRGGRKLRGLKELPASSLSEIFRHH